MSAETEDPIPYPLPDNWDERGMAPVSTVAYAIMAITAAVLLLLGTARALRGDTGGTVLWAVVFGVLMAWLSVSREGPPRRYRGPVLMNAVALTRADQQPPDSWVHFFRQQLASWGLGWALLIGGAGSGGLLVVLAHVLLLAREAAPRRGRYERFNHGFASKGSPPAGGIHGRSVAGGIFGWPPRWTTQP